MIPDRIMRKIQRCLALSESANAHEAGIALRQAQALMAEYGVSHEQLALADFTASGVDTLAGRTPPRYLESLAQLINAAFGTSTLYSCRRTRHGWRGAFEFIGPRDAVQVASYAFTVLQRQLIRDRRDYLASKPRLKRLTKTRRGDAFAEAWILGARQSVTPMAMTEELLALHQAYQRHRCGGEPESLTTREHAPLRHHDYAAVTAGYAAGQAAQLVAGVSATQREALSHD